MEEESNGLLQKNVHVQKFACNFEGIEVHPWNLNLKPLSLLLNNPMKRLGVERGNSNTK
jgi:hypothetical protein